MFEKTNNKRKRGRGLPIFQKISHRAPPHFSRFNIFSWFSVDVRLSQHCCNNYCCYNGTTPHSLTLQPPSFEFYFMLGQICQKIRSIVRAQKWVLKMHRYQLNDSKNYLAYGGRPGLVVKREDSWSRGHEFGYLWDILNISTDDWWDNVSKAMFWHIDSSTYSRVQAESTHRWGEVSLCGWSTVLQVWIQLLHLVKSSLVKPVTLYSDPSHNGECTQV